MTHEQLICFRTLVLAAIFTVNISHAQSGSYAVTERGADYAVHQKTVVENGTNHVHQYTELATGLNYTNASGQLVESKEEIDVLPQGGAAATQGRHQAYFPGDIYQGVIEVVTPDGKHLKSRPLGISYDDGTNTVLIAVLTNSVGVLVSSNQVVYPDAFTGFKADLRYTYRKGGFEQDIVIREQPPTPESFGLSSQNVRLQMLTEFFNAPEPKQARMQARKKNGMADTTLTFGKMQMIQGKAFSIGSQNSQRSTFNSQRVYKSWQHLGARTFLVEELPVQTIATQLEQLPDAANAQTGMAHLVSHHLVLPPAHEFVSNTNRILVASVDLHYKSGVVLDYDEIDSGTNDFTFETGQTYYISSGGIYFSGTTTIEGGTVIKFPEDGGGGIYCPNVVCATTAYNPAVFTSANDNSVGDSIDGSSGSPAEGGNSYLEDLNPVEFDHLRFSYAGTSLAVDSGSVINDCQFSQCYYGIVGGDIVVNNSLVSGCTYCLDAGGVCENCTFDTCTGVSDNDTEFTNCIFSSVTSVGYVYYDPDLVIDGGHNGFYGGSPTFGDNIVTGSIVDAGSVTADQVGLYWWTTQGPIEGTSIVDLGYHTPAVDGDGNPISTLVSGVPDYLADANGNGLPDSWETNYFGNLNQYASELDGLGNTLFYDYANGVDLSATVQFTIEVTNTYVNTNNVSMQLNITAGVPGDYAVLINDTNQADADWQSLVSTNLTVSLGSTDGVYDVSVGLIGLPANATQTWQDEMITLDTVAPVVTITNPAAGTVSVPMIQLQGFASENLGSLTFDVSNASGIFTNQTGYVTDEFWDTNLLIFTTNYFQCYDISLTNGLNQIILHATDLAGNETTTNVSFTLDYSGDTTAPIIQIVWPTNGTSISGSSFTFEGQVDDAMATIVATIVDEDGDTNAVQGLVERDGKISIANLPMSAGANILTVTATDAAGNSTTTNLTLAQSSVTVTMDPLSSGQFNQSSVSVTGTISDPSGDVCIQVNGTNAYYLDDDGDWEADNVPISPTGTAAFDVELYTNDPVNIGSQVFAQVQPPLVTLENYTDDIDYSGDAIGRLKVQWNYANGGSYDMDVVSDDPIQGELHWFGMSELQPDGTNYTIPATTYGYNFYNVDGSLYADISGEFPPVWRNANDQLEMPDVPGAPEYGFYTFQKFLQTTPMIVSAGPKLPGVTKTYTVRACAMFAPPADDEFDFLVGELSSVDTDGTDVPPEQLQINGKALANSGVTNSDGSVWGTTSVSAPAGALVPLTVTCTNPTNNDYSFNVEIVKDKLYWQNMVQAEIDTDSGVVIEKYNPANGFMANRKNLQGVYAFYQKLFTENTNLLWAGLGKLAGAPVYGGLSDGEHGRQAAMLAAAAAALIGAESTYMAATNLANDLITFQNTLITMNTNILQDLAWQSEAYYKGGLQALNVIYAGETNALDAPTIAAWREIDDGVQNNIASEIQDGNLQLAHREQLTILQPNYDTLNTVGGVITNVMSILAQNPVPTGTNFLTVVPSGNLCAFPDRWNWITNSAGGIWPAWIAASPTTQSGWVNIPLTTRATNYALISPIIQ